MSRAPGRAAGKSATTLQVVKTVNLALQGFGSHSGAYTWGVLDALAEDTRIRISAISSTGVGTMNGVVFAAGMDEGGRDVAREKLAKFWLSVSSEGALSPFEPRYVAALVDFERLRASNEHKLYVAATNIRTGRTAILQNNVVAGQPSKSSFLAGADKFESHPEYELPFVVSRDEKVVANYRLANLTGGGVGPDLLFETPDLKGILKNGGPGTGNGWKLDTAMRRQFPWTRARISSTSIVRARSRRSSASRLATTERRPGKSGASERAHGWKIRTRSESRNFLLRRTPRRCARLGSTGPRRSALG